MIIMDGDQNHDDLIVIKSEPYQEFILGGFFALGMIKMFPTSLLQMIICEVREMIALQSDLSIQKGIHPQIFGGGEKKKTEDLAQIFPNSLFLFCF